MTADEDDPYAAAACRDEDPDLFFPVRVNVGRRIVTDDELYAPARAVCASCPIREQCLDEHRHERHGMWGGATPAERGIVKSRRTGRKAHVSIEAWVLQHRGCELTVSMISEGTGYSASSVRQVLPKMVEAEQVIQLDRRRWLVAHGLVSA